VEKVLRHRDPKLTEAVYGHLETDYLRAEVKPAQARHTGIGPGGALPDAP
jgi:hypothetical protein